MSELETLFTKYGTDKGIWGYTPAYEQIFAGRRLEVKRVLEIGICGHRDIPNNVIGASLFAWRDYFPNAQIFGLDNDSKWIFNDQQRITTCCVDAYNSAQLHEVLERIGGEFDFVCDDAVHDPLPQLSLAHDLVPHLTADGVYAIEDVCPYKVMGGTLLPMVQLLPRELTQVREIMTHKEERLLLARR